ncbi:MFS transporter [Marinobacterium mangrovicola]|uniref:Putative MFS family arabinose efflux permease n=1 Tax=Marinobacterium mangrovicola TaxID=1476959 RepID=A0A4R1GGU3_9GAMM|nr:MFS transporter [Marinobacterium mangrovicola]TCK07564.1 putative MFS family arabinose efflux permease [Marinobacterium mangrovicola]
MNTERQAGLPQSLLLLLGSCLPVLGAVLIAPVLPRMQSHFVGTPGLEALVPIALTIPALVIALTAPFAGLVADRFGRRRLLLVSMIVYSIFGLMPFWLDSLVGIVISRAGLGFAEAGIMTCCTTLIGDYYGGKRREKLFALQAVVTSLSAAVFISVGGVLGEQGWRTPFVLYAAGFIFLPLMAWLLWEPVKHHAQAAAGQDETFPWGGLAPLYLLSFLAGISLFIVPVQAGFLLTQLQIDAPQDIGMTMGANQLGVLLGALGFRLISSRSSGSLLMLGFSLAGAGGILMAFAQTHMLVTLAVLINGLGVGLMLPTLITRIMSQVELRQRGRAAGGFTATLFGGEFASPLVVLAMTGGFGVALTSALMAVGLAQLLVAVLCVTLIRFRAPVPAAT